MIILEWVVLERSQKQSNNNVFSSSGTKRHRERIPDVWGLLAQTQRSETLNNDTESRIWTLRLDQEERLLKIGLSWATSGSLHLWYINFKTQVLSWPHFDYKGLFLWPDLVCGVHFWAHVMLVSPCFQTLLPFPSVTRRSPLWGIVMRGVLLSCESCSDHLVCPRPHTEWTQQ